MKLNICDLFLLTYTSFFFFFFFFFTQDLISSIAEITTLENMFKDSFNGCRIGTATFKLLLLYTLFLNLKLIFPTCSI